MKKILKLTTEKKNFQILQDNTINKSLSFTKKERAQDGLRLIWKD